MTLSAIAGRWFAGEGVILGRGRRRAAEGVLEGGAGPGGRRPALVLAPVERGLLGIRLGGEAGVAGLRLGFHDIPRMYM